MTASKMKATLPKFTAETVAIIFKTAEQVPRFTAAQVRTPLKTPATAAHFPAAQATILL